MKNNKDKKRKRVKEKVDKLIDEGFTGGLRIDFNGGVPIIMTETTKMK